MNKVFYKNNTKGTESDSMDPKNFRPDGKKIRSKNDLFRYCEEFKVTCDVEKFDFSVKNMKGLIFLFLQ